MPVDKLLVRSRFSRHYKDYQQYAVVQKRIAEHLAQALAPHLPLERVHRALEIGMGTGFLSQHLAQLYPDAQWYFNDMVPEALEWVPEQLAHQKALVGDIEALDLPSGLDLIASASALQWLRDLGAFFRRAYAALSPGGTLAFSSFGPQHMGELRHITGQGLNYLSLGDVSAMLQAEGFQVIAQEEWQRVLYFETGRRVLEHLRRTGVNSTAAQTWTPRMLLKFCKDYESAFLTAEAQLPLTYHPLLLIAQKPLS